MLCGCDTGTQRHPGENRLQLIAFLGISPAHAARFPVKRGILAWGICSIVRWVHAYPSASQSNTVHTTALQCIIVHSTASQSITLHCSAFKVPYGAVHSVVAVHYIARKMHHSASPSIEMHHSALPLH